jgi:hypothetical protein
MAGTLISGGLAAPRPARQELATEAPPPEEPENQQDEEDDDDDREDAHDA